MLVAQGNFIIILSATPQCLWKGIEVTGVSKIKVKYHDGVLVAKLKVKGIQTEIYDEMIAAGIVVKKERI